MVNLDNFIGLQGAVSGPLVHVPRVARSGG